MDEERIDEEQEGGGEEDSVLKEEEYNEHEDLEAEQTSHPQKWWSDVNAVCNDNDNKGDGDSNGFVSESDLESLCSDEDEQLTKKSKREYNPRSNLADFKFKLGMQFPTMGHLRHILREESIQNDKEFQYIFNDVELCSSYYNC